MFGNCSGAVLGALGMCLVILPSTPASLMSAWFPEPGDLGWPGRRAFEVIWPSRCYSSGTADKDDKDEFQRNAHSCGTERWQSLV